jgi:hypothetical protein
LWRLWRLCLRLEKEAALFTSLLAFEDGLYAEECREWLGASGE